VTVGRFRQFVGAWNGGNGFLPAAGSGKHVYLNNGKGLADSANPGGYEPGWATSDNGTVAPTNGNLQCDSSFQTWTSSPGSQENLPINCVTWPEAYAFCIWDGGFLPSETERLYAQAGGSQQLEYPWGSADPGTGNQYAIYGCYYPNQSGSCNDVTSIAPVGTPKQGAGVWGQLDLAGNLWDWNLDWFASYQNPCTDCAFLTPVSTTDRVERGGYWGGVVTKLTGWSRTSDMPVQRGSYLGFRCARAP
jgi:formylglycine-generating enzyme required for sulfatase activity